MRHGFLIDMDGVLHHGAKLIHGADRFIRELVAHDIPFRLLTNNSQRTRRDVVTRLARLGIAVDEEHVFTSAMATARFLAQQKPGGTAFVIGEGGLLTALHQNGYAIVDQDPDYVVIGEGRTLNLEMVDRAVRMILGGAKLIATDETTIVGDMMTTDILGGVQLGLHTVLVLTGGTRLEDLDRYAYRPELVVSSVDELARMLEEGDWEPPYSLSA
jgi:NagD protein